MARAETVYHLLQHHPRQRVAISEVRVGRERHLVLIVRSPGPWALHDDAPATQCDLAVLVPMTHRGALRELRVLGAHDLIKLGLHHLTEHPQPNTDTQREQPILRRTSQLAQRLLHPCRQHALWACVLLLLYGLHGGSSRLDGLVRTRHGPSRTGRGERTATYKLLHATGQPHNAESLGLWSAGELCVCGDAYPILLLLGDGYLPGRQVGLCARKR